MTVFARTAHGADAEAASLPLCPAELLALGNARAGMPLTQAAQTVGIDLPLKALVWQGALRRALAVVAREVTGSPKEDP